MDQILTRVLLEAIHFTGSSSLANRRLRGAGSILMLHRVVREMPGGFAPNRHLSITATFLDKLLERLRKSIFEFVDMDEAARRIRLASEGAVGERPFLAVTLDDGSRDNLKNALPVFRRHSVPYTIYVSPGLVDGRATLWWEDLANLVASRDVIHIDLPGGRTEIELRDEKAQRRAYRDLLAYATERLDEHEQRRLVSGLCWMYGIDAQAHRAESIMTWDELRTISADPLCTLGAHTIHHFALRRLPEREARLEMIESGRLVELETGKAPRHFAYPYGYPAAAGEREFELARAAGFQTAVTTRHGVCYPEHAGHLHALPRISINGNFQRYRYAKALLSGATTRLSNRGARLNVT